MIEIYKWAIPVIMTAMTGFIIKQFSDSKAIKNAMIALLRSQIVSMCEMYQSIGTLPDHARYTLTELSNNYTTLGANHGIELLVKATLSLPIECKNRKEN